MPPKKTENLPLTFPRVSPIEASQDFWQSKVEAKRIRYAPIWDKARDCVLLDLVEARRVRRNAEESLVAKRKEAVKSRGMLDQKWTHLFEVENSLRQMFVKFNKFVKENQEKRDRAAKRAKDEQALQRKRHKETEALRRKFAHVSRVKGEMELRIKDYRMYEDYLDGVVKMSAYYKNINDILLRYEALVEARSALSLKQTADLGTLETAKGAMEKLIGEKQLAIVGHLNHLASLQERYSVANQKTLLWETVVQRIQDVSAQELAQIQQVEASCYDLYLDVCSRRQMQATSQRRDTREHLLAIKETLRMLGKVVAIVTDKRYSG